ncbi:MAG: alpha/beta fold hydrolase [Deltaproteobacteria bacterium]|nr:alpha/beta fold hydrolase [Deltaproteobacteria bacterium]
MSSFGPTELLRRAGAFTVIPQALARMNGAVTLARLTLEKAPVPVAPSPAALIKSEGAARLLRYEPMPGLPARDPILLCPSLINRLYVLDLKEGISVVEALRKAGHRVYGIDWGEPGAEERGVSFEGFVQRLSRFVDAACSDAKVHKLHLLGHCLGGTMATALAATNDARVQTLINLTAPLSFHDEGLLSKWTRAPFFDAEAVVAALGHVPPWLTQPAFQILKPMGQPAKALRLFQALDKPAGELDAFLETFRCLETWINDNVSIPDRFFVDLVGTLYRKDALAKGELSFERGPVKLDDVRVPVFTIAAAEDHIVPPASATSQAARFTNPACKTEVLPGGHIGVVVGGLGRKRLWPALIAWMDEHKLGGVA